MREPAIYPRMEEWLAYLNRNHNPNAMWGQLHKGNVINIPTPKAGDIYDVERLMRKQTRNAKWVQSVIRKLERAHDESQGVEVSKEEQTA